MFVMCKVLKSKVPKHLEQKLENKAQPSFFKTKVRYVSYIHVIEVFLPSQSLWRKHNKEKIPQTFAHLVNFSKNVSAMFDNQTNLVILTIG